MEKLWTTSEVARFLGIDEAGVEEMVRQGRLTGYKLGGQFLRFRPDQVEGLKRTLRSKPSAAAAAKATRPRRPGHVSEFLYFYDFYIVSATFLALLVIYLIAAG